MNMMQLAQSLMQQNPQAVNNPNAKAMLDVVMSGDANRGQQIARNLCQSMGISEQDAIAQARKFFGV